MEYLIVVFRSRTETYNFSYLLKSYGVFSSIINTPRQVTVACGLCVKTRICDLNLIKSLLSRRNFSSFVGIFKITGNYNGIVSTNIY